MNQLSLVENFNAIIYGTAEEPLFLARDIAEMLEIKNNRDMLNIAQFKAADNKFTAYNTFKVDDIKFHNGIWQFVSYQLNGSKDVNWDDNGIPLSVVDNVTRGNDADTQIGDTVKFSDAFNQGTIGEYHNETNAIGIDTGGYGRIWYNADAFLKI